MKTFPICVIICLLTGCRTHHSSYHSYAPAIGWKSGIVYRDGVDRMSTYLSDEDYRQVEKILCSISVLGDPVYVVQIFPASLGRSIWCFRCIKNGGLIDVYISRDYNLVDSRWCFVVTEGGLRP